MIYTDGTYYLPDYYVKTGYSGLDPNLPVRTNIAAVEYCVLLTTKLTRLAIIPAAVAVAQELTLLPRPKPKTVLQ